MNAVYGESSEAFERGPYTWLADRIEMHAVANQSTLGFTGRFSSHREGRAAKPISAPKVHDPSTLPAKTSHC